MSGINLTSAMRTNLLNLQDTAANMNITQQRLATGLKVNSPLDNPTNFFAAAGMRARADDMTSLKDGMGNAIQAIKTATTAITGITNLLKAGKGMIEAARAANATDRASLGKQYDEVLKQVDQMVLDSDFQGLSFLGSAKNTGSTKTLDVHFDNRSARYTSSKLTISGFDAVHTALGSTGVTSANATWSVNSGVNLNSNLNSQSAQINRAISYLQTEASKLASNLAIVNARLDYTNNMVNTLNEGADKLTLADQNEEGANMLTLQTRQSLGITALSLASQSAQGILRLF